VIVALGGLGLRLQRDLEAAQVYRDGVSASLALAAQPGSQAALLAADDGSVSGIGVVGADGTVKIAMRGLPATTGSEVYTAWSISGGSAPVPIGEFTVGSDGTAVATAYAQAPGQGVVLAVTLEAHAGATTPTLPIVAKGVARPPTG
jgi:anti-sigma-K factor RskA